MTARAAQQIKFAKMPLRSRAGSSPLRTSNIMDGPSVMVTSPSRPGESSHLRRGSLGAISGRPRRDTTNTTTSSEMSSENEFETGLFQRKPVTSRQARASKLLSERIQEDEREEEAEDEEDSADGGDTDSTMSSALVGSADSGSILGSLSSKLTGIMTSTPNTLNTSPRKQRLLPPSALQALPPPRPISVVAPVSLLSRALNAGKETPEKNFVKFALLTGKGTPNPISLRIHIPFGNSTRRFEMTVRRFTEDGHVMVAQAIGLALYEYTEQGHEPHLSLDKINVNKWNFRMMDDGDVEYDFPPLGRTRPVTDFTLNNNRPPRARARDPWDEFALVEATERELKENEAATPQFGAEASVAPKSAPKPMLAPAFTMAPRIPVTALPYRNPITDPAFAAKLFRTRKESVESTAAPAVVPVSTSAPTNAPAVPAFPHATPRTGLTKKLNIRFTDENLVTRSTLIEVTTDTYIAEVFDQVCKRLNVDKALYVLKVAQSSTVVPQDRTVEALGDRADLDLSRRRFVGDGSFGLAGSPGSSSPNAPLMIAPLGTPTKRSKRAPYAYPQTFSGLPRQDTLSLNPATTNYKRYNVIRKTARSFSSSARIIMLDGEFVHLLPSEGPKAMWEQSQGKTTTIPFSNVVGCQVTRRHPRMFRVLVWTEREQKPYNFEALTQDEANEIVAEIRKGMESSMGAGGVGFGEFRG
jgi:hypothetical protein